MRLAINKYKLSEFIIFLIQVSSLLLQKYLIPPCCMSYSCQILVPCIPYSPSFEHIHGTYEEPFRL
jgi:hypothetical protein